MIPVRRRSSDAVVPEGWGRTHESYSRAGRAATNRSVQPNTKTAKAQKERLDRKRARWRDELEAILSAS